MAFVFPAQVLAIQVGSSFVGQYYLVIQHDPNIAYGYYSEASTMMRVDGGRACSAVGMQQIHNLIMNLNYTGIEINLVHSVGSWNGGILVMVSGSLQCINYINRRKFVQTFFLAPQQRGYFVLNDIFQFTEDEQINPTILAHSNYEANIVAPDPIQESVCSRYASREMIQTENCAMQVLPEQTDKADRYGTADPSHQVPEYANKLDEISTFTKTTEVARDLPSSSVKEPIGEQPKQTYASILQVAKGQSAELVSNRTPSNKSPLVSKLQFAQISAQHSQGASNSLKDTLKNEGNSRSVYVGDLPASITTSELEEEFKKYGKLRSKGVTIKSRKEPGGFYAFIEFEDETGVSNALKASPIQLDGRVFHVERRRTNNNSSRRGRGRRGRGKGGYHQ